MSQFLQASDQTPSEMTRRRPPAGPWSVLRTLLWCGAQKWTINGLVTNSDSHQQHHVNDKSIQLISIRGEGRRATLILLLMMRGFLINTLFIITILFIPVIHGGVGALALLNIASQGFDAIMGHFKSKVANKLTSAKSLLPATSITFDDNPLIAWKQQDNHLSSDYEHYAGKWKDYWYAKQIKSYR